MKKHSSFFVLLILIQVTAVFEMVLIPSLFVLVKRNVLFFYKSENLFLVLIQPLN